MHDTQMFARLLGVVEPWTVDRVKLALKEGDVHVYLRHEQGTPWPCPTCEKPCRLYDHQPERQWRHLDVFQYRTILHAAPPRCRCDEHGVLAVKLPWAEPNSRFTALFEECTIFWLRVASQSAVSKQLRLSWDEAHAIMERAVGRGLKRRKAEPIPVIGIDEKAFRKGHNYLTLVSDHEGSRVLYVAEDRKEASLNGFWPTLTDEQKAGIRAITMDMWEPYVQSIRANLSDGEQKIVYDKYHIAAHLGRAVDLVRRRENRELRRRGDDRLVGSKYDWLTNPANFTRAAWLAFSRLRTSDLRTARAWALKESGMRLFDYHYQGAARRHFKHWSWWATHSRLRPMIDVAKMLKRRLDNILTYLEHGVTNAVSESINSRIQWVKYTARGFRNKANYVTAIYFHCGGLDLTPRPT